MKDQNGKQIIGAYNTGDWYEFAYVTAQSKGGGREVTVVPLLGGTDISIARKNMPVYQVFVAIGCIGDKNLSDPSSWLMVACLPPYDDKAARAAKRKLEGPYGIKRRKVEPEYY